MQTVNTADRIASGDIVVQAVFESEMMDLGGTGFGITIRTKAVEPKMMDLAESELLVIEQCCRES